MKNDLAKRLFLAALMVILAAMLLLCLEGRTLMRLNAEVRHERKNTSLYLEKRGDGIFFIGGEGKLNSSDLLALVEGEGNKNDARGIIIGDGITELDYNALVSFEGLTTLWLGRDMKIIDNSSIKDCISLQFVFVPGGLERCGRDFLYNCNKCYVVTDGEAKKLPKLRNTSSKRVLEGVNSLEALADACAPGMELPEGIKWWWP